MIKKFLTNLCAFAHLFVFIWNHFVYFAHFNKGTEAGVVDAMDEDILALQADSTGLIVDVDGKEIASRQGSSRTRPGSTSTSCFPSSTPPSRAVALVLTLETAVAASGTNLVGGFDRCKS
jgi:hypothetical protein